jgi:chromosome segregation and condensation protein ScpB
VSQAGIEHIHGTASDGALGTLLQRGLVAVDEHRLVRTTPGFLHYLGLRDLADLPPLPDPAPSAQEMAAVVGPVGPDEPAVVTPIVPARARLDRAEE